MKSLIFSALILILPTFASAEERLGVGHYMENEVEAGQYICEPGNTLGEVGQCYFVNDFSRTITPENDTSGALEAGYVSEKQGAFLEVKLDELATSNHPENFQGQSFDFYIKLQWEGQAQTPEDLGLDIDDNHVIKGLVYWLEDSEPAIEIISVPDLFMLEMFMPDISLATMFGRNAQTEAYELEHDSLMWMTHVINPVLKAYFNEAPQNPPVEIDRP